MAKKRKSLKTVSGLPDGASMQHYAEREYGLTSAQMKIVAKKLHAKAKKARCAGKAKVFKGDIEALLKD